ncbi:MAG TPA: DnaJ C-terminal domain-containing protein, partial [Ignavibacteriaceae bacterium]|nr:DnaJ C-terminal domain-containing protein [Ignavibacteriaceae bacterium]
AEAYEILNDDNKRARYDRFGHEGVKGSGFGSPGFSDINDIFSHFSDIFGGGSIFDEFFGSSSRSRGRRRGSGTPGTDLRVTLKLTLEEIATGVSKKIKIKKLIQCDQCNGSGAADNTSKKTCPVCQGSGEIRNVSRSVFGQFVNISGCANCDGEGIVVDSPCRKCAGDGRYQNEVTVKIDVPPGVHEGSYMSMRGEGNAGKRGGSSGDIIVVFKEQEHEHFIREDSDIIYNLAISFPEAVLGAEVDVPTLNGKARLKIDSGTPNGKLLKMTGKGIKHLNHSGYGDQIVKINIDVPRKLTSKEKELLTELSEQPNFKGEIKDSEKGFFKRFGL